MKKRMYLFLIPLVLGCVLVVMNLSWLRTLYYTLIDPNDPLAFAHYPTGNIAQDLIYEFNSSTILPELQAGKTVVFDPLSGPPPEGTYSFAPTGTPSGTYPWKQADYLLVAAAIHQHAWGKSLDRWDLYDLTFGISECQENIRGFDYARIIYLKKRITTFSVEEMRILPLYGEAFWGDVIYERLGDWASIDLTGMTIAAEDAFRIAEEHGGMNARRSVTNDCHVTVNLVFNVSKDRWDWDVNYYRTSDPGRIFEMYINSYTGEFEKGVDKSTP